MYSLASNRVFQLKFLRAYFLLYGVRSTLRVTLVTSDLILRLYLDIGLLSLSLAAVSWGWMILLGAIQSAVYLPFPSLG